MRRLIPVLPVLLALAACAPPKPPIFVQTNASNESIGRVKEGRFALQAIQKVDLHDFKRAFVKRYESEEAFLKTFQADLDKALNAEARPEAATFTVELPNLDVDSHTVGYWVTTGGGPNMPPMQTYHSTEYCDIRLVYRVKDAQGQVVLEGTVKESTAKGEFLHPNQTKLANAVEGIQRHLADYLRGRMPAENVGPVAAPKDAKS